MTTPSTQKTAPVRFVELVRVSSQGQAARDTPEDQRAALDRLRTSRPGVLVERIDSAVSGAMDSDDRADVQRLATLARARAFDEVRVRHTDRLTRHDDPRERFAIYGLIADAGAVIVDAAGRVIDPHSELGEMTWYFETLMASKERKRILERTMAAKRRLAAEGRLVTWPPPFARTFDKATGRWGTDPKHLATYRRLFDFVLRGRTLRQIVAQLNEEGVTTPKGRDWTPGTVYNLLRAPHAAGRFRAYGAETRIPPVVDEATQAAALARLKANDLASGRHDVSPALLRKIAVCGVCGEPLYTDRHAFGGRTWTVYYCRARSDCYRSHRVEAVDAAVKEQVENWLRRPGALAAAAGADRSKVRQEAEAALREARAELRDLDRQEERLARLGRRGTISARVVAQQAGEIARLRAGAEREAADAAARVEGETRLVARSAEVGARIADLRARIAGAGFAEWRALVELLFPRGSIAVWPNGTIKLNGALPLDDAGEEILRETGRDLSTPSRTS
jgi:DNA invertase Pin-like site-specific DNA recombinase